MQRRGILTTLGTVFLSGGCLQLADSQNTATRTATATESAGTATGTRSPGPTDSPTNSPTESRQTASETDEPTETDSPTDSATESETPTETASPTEAEQLGVAFRHTYERQNLADAVGSVDGENESALGYQTTESGDTALTFPGDGVGDDGGFYEIPDSSLQSEFEEGESMSLRAVVKRRPSDDWGWEMLYNGSGMVLDIRSGQLRFRWYEPGRGSVFSVTAPVRNYDFTQWTDIVGVLDAEAGEVTLYVDGRRVDATSTDADIGFSPGVKADHVRIGFHPTADDGAFDSHFGGLLNRLTGFDRALTAEQIASLAAERTALW